MARRRILLICTCLGFLTASTHAYSGGAGTPADPYQIATAGDLVALGQTPDDYNKHFILTADIDLSGHTFTQAVIAPDADSSDSILDGVPFSGVFDGCGHAVRQLDIHGKGYLGLFGQTVMGSIIRNVAVEEVSIEGAGVFIGGLIGQNWAGVVHNCSVTGEITATGYRIGGLIGSNWGGNVSKSCGVVAVTGQAVGVGGLVGRNGGHMSSCCSAGEVAGDCSVGGLAGINYGSMSDCCSTSAVTGNSEVGGLVGKNDVDRTVSKCYSSGVVIGETTIGGLVGHNLGSVQSSFWDLDGSACDTSDGGHGLSEAQMQRTSTYLNAGWDFVGEIENGAVEIWQIDDGQGYPFIPDAGLVKAYSYSGGNGTADAPFHIASLADFLHFRKTPDDYDKHFVLTVDIDLAGHAFTGAVIAPAQFRYRLQQYSYFVQPDGVPFSGVLIGNNHVIRDFCVEGGDFYGSECLGLFGHLASSARVSDIRIEGVVIQHEDDLAGGLAAYSDGWVSNCYCSGEIVEGAPSGGYDGGLIGLNTGHISDCGTTIEIRGGGPYAGGLVAYSYGGRVSRCHSNATVVGSSTVGGLVAYNDEGLIWDCHSTSTISGAKGCVGGLVGTNHFSRIWNCYSSGEIMGQGGLVGHNEYGHVSNCYSTAMVTGPWTIGGLIGYNEGRVMNCFSTGRVLGEDAHPHGLIGRNDPDLSERSLRGIVENCFWDMESSGLVESRGGVGLTTAQMQDINTFLDAGWDFLGESANGTAETWQMPEEGGYPQLDLVEPVTPAGQGTQDKPFLITNAEELGAVRYRPLVHYRLETNLDLSGITWCGAVVPCFGGCFDGNGHVISGLDIKGGDTPALFGYLASSAVVTDLGLAEGSIQGRYTWVGSLAGQNEGIVRNCYNAAAITAQGARIGIVGGSGGVVGHNSGSLLNCYNTGRLDGDDGYFGGLIGYNVGSVFNCYNVGGVTGELPWVCRRGQTPCPSLEAGGLFGYNSGDVVQSFWDIESTGKTEDRGGVGLTSVEMQDIDTYLAAGWDFVDEVENGTEDIWWIEDGWGYPRLAWELVDGQ